MNEGLCKFCGQEHSMDECQLGDKDYRSDPDYGKVEERAAMHEKITHSTAMNVLMDQQNLNLSYMILGKLINESLNSDNRTDIYLCRTNSMLEVYPRGSVYCKCKGCKSFKMCEIRMQIIDLLNKN